MAHALLGLSLLVQFAIDSARLARAADGVLGAMPSGLAGAAVVVIHGERVVFSKGYGSAGRSGSVRPDRTLFRAASVGKLFVATAAMQAAAAGKLDIDRDIAVYVPELELRRHGWPPITMRQLLSHTAGVEDAFSGTIERVGATTTTLAELFQRRLPSVGPPPGEQVNYSNLGVALGALVVERVTGTPFAEYVAMNIFAPLAMNHSTYAEPLPRELRAFVAGDTTMMQYRLIPYPAGSLVTTASDMGRFIAAHLNGGALGTSRILDSMSLAAMHTRVWSAHPEMSGVAVAFFEGELGGKRLLFHTGSRGHHSALVLVPSERFGFYAVLDARQGVSGALLEELTQALLGARWRTNAHDTASPDSTREYAGRYRLNAGSQHSFEKLAKLAMGDVVVTRDSRGLILHRERPMPLRSMAPDLFQTADGMFVAFHRSTKGSVDRMHASGRLMDGVSLDRLQFWESSTLHRATLGGSFALAWIVTVGTVVAALWRRIRRLPRRPAWPWPRRLTRAATALYALAPLPAVFVMLTVPDATVVELTPAIAAVRGIVGIAAMIALGALGAVPLGVGGTRPFRVRDALFAVMALATMIVLAYWRVLPLPG